MLEYDKIYISEGIDIKKTIVSKECDICHYWYFSGKSFKYEPYICNGCHDFMQKAMNLNDVPIVSKMNFWYMSKDDVINIMKNSNLNEKVDHYKFFSSYIKSK